MYKIFVLSRRSSYHVNFSLQTLLKGNKLNSKIGRFLNIFQKLPYNFKYFVSKKTGESNIKKSRKGPGRFA